MTAQVNRVKRFKRMDDHQVWQTFKEGDKEALEFIFQSNVRQLFNYGMKICTDSAVVEDCIQELFINLWDQRIRLSNTDNIHFYLVKALRWKIIRAVEATHKKKKQLSDYLTSFVSEIDLPYEDLLINEQIATENTEKLRRALNQLPSRQKEVIHLIFFKKYSYEQISQIMSLNLRSVYTLAWKALSNLKKSVITILLWISIYIA